MFALGQNLFRLFDIFVIKAISQLDPRVLYRKVGLQTVMQIHENLARDKHSSLFYPAVIDNGKKVL